MDIFVSAGTNNLEELNKRINEGVDVNARNGMPAMNTPLHIAAMHGNGDCVALLLNAGALPNIKNGNGVTALHCAAADGTSVKAIQALIQNGADVNSFVKNNDTPLHLAARNNGGDADCVQALLQGGADYTLQNSQGKTAEDYAPDGAVNRVFRDHRIAQEKQALLQTVNQVTPTTEQKCRGRSRM